MQQIDFYCKKTMKMSYELTGDMDAPVLPGMIIRCNVNYIAKTIKRWPHDMGACWFDIGLMPVRT